MYYFVIFVIFVYYFVIFKRKGNQQRLTQMFNLAEKEFKVAIMSMFKNVKENNMAINEQV